MADTIITRVRKDLIYNLETIQAGETYTNTLRDVYALGQSHDNVEEFPSCQVNSQSYDYDRETNNYQNDVIETVDLIFTLKTDDPITDRESILEDLHTLIGDDVKERAGFFPNADGVSVIRSAQIVKVSFSGIEETKPLYKIFVTLELGFSFSVSDPTSLP